MENLKPCPFCGGETEMHELTGQSFQRTFCKTIDDVNDYLDEHRRFGGVVNEHVERLWHKSTGYSGSRKSGYYFSVSAEYLLFVPRRADPKCSEIGYRAWKECVRVFGSVEAAAAGLRIGVYTIYSWHRHGTTPNANILATMMTSGCDVKYILTGKIDDRIKRISSIEKHIRRNRHD